MQKSNINLASKVYIKTETEEYDDIAYVEQIVGYNALNKMSTKAKSASFQLNLTNAPEKELKRNIPCTEMSNKLNEQTFGAVEIDNEIVWSCRCENVVCDKYEDCMRLPNSKRIDRDYIHIESIADSIEPKPEVDEKVFVDIINTISIENTKKNIEKFYFEDTAFNYTKIGDITPIIEAPIKDLMIVNAPSDSGKTRTVIERLNYVIDNKYVENVANILVICFAKTTQNFIKSSLPVEGKEVLVYTLDNFATKCLYEIEDSEYELLNNNQRIDKFNSQITQIDLSNYELLIIDELNDFQNQRAMMILNVIRKVHCGVLLLGDKSQALYQDESSSSSISVDVVKLYNLLNKVLPRKIKKYEVMTDFSEADELVQITRTIREGLLYKNLTECKKIIAREFEKIPREYTPIEKFKPIIKSKDSLAFLCKNEHEAEYVSSILYKNKIAHNLIRNLPNKYSCNRWIADVLWDHCSDLITKDDFVDRYKARISDNEGSALKLFNLLLEFTKEYYEEIEEDFIDKNELLLKFVNGNEPLVEFTNKNDSQIIVSTVFKSKGEKFDHVYLVNFELDNIYDEDIKIDRLHEMYVGLLRAKQSVKMIELKTKVNFKSTENNRLYRTFKKYNKEYCTHFSVGDDIAIDCFILGNFKEVLKSQRYISEVVRVNDKVELILQDEQYLIYHIQNTRTSQKLSENIGVISNDAFNDIKQAVSNYNNGILPTRLYDLYISQVVTIPQNVPAKKIAVQFRNSKFIIGIEISGFAKLDWNY